MKFTSSRGGMAPVGFSEILLEGLAPDGGLAVPDSFPHISAATLAEWRNFSYPQLAFEIVSRFATDIDPQALRRIIDATYTKAVFGTEAVTPLQKLEEDLYILELSNGPTLAFKDIAMQLLGGLFEYELQRRGQSLNILGATSGDTGSAAEYAMRGKKGVKVFMLSPEGKMSSFQRAQMYSLQDPNIHNIAIKGFFDDCQDIVKAVSEDLTFKSDYKIGTVNSINWGRITAQVVYYFKAYLALAKQIGDPVSFSVPSGNFGNVLAGHIARQMGLPIHRLVVATNENDVLDEFFKTGVYRPRTSAETHETSSPSMDISKASNFERFIYDLVGRDASATAALWKQLATRGAFDLSDLPAFKAVEQTFGFQSGASSHENRLQTIRLAHEKYGRLIDTHTADGLKVALEKREAGVPMVVLETALPEKFAETIVEAIGIQPKRRPEHENIEDLPQRVQLLPTSVDQVKAYIQKNA